ncbi:Dcp1p-Dcp2p decapping enzyme complex alpha subunit [Tulasnella sp. 425]|nr:Dcp1p-Dcp2p decapping enzyme complex alpha subunit [Tulasnella sp. 425]
MPPLPTLPGEFIESRDEVNVLRSDVARLLGLESTSYWVCEKSDGIRVLVYIKLIPHSNEQEVYLIDRKNDYRRVHGLYIPHHEDPRNGLRDTLLDGELVLDVDPVTRRETLRLLAFDCLAVDGTRIMEKSLTSRYGKLQQWVFKPFAAMLSQFPNLAADLPFDLQVKRMERSYSIASVLNEVIPKLQHGHDGLVYTCATTRYVVGTDDTLLKWKPPSENSVDFKLELRFPPSKTHPDGLDYYSKPTFVLLAWAGGNKYDYFDTMQVSEDEWERMKETGEQFDDRVVEVVWNFAERNWKILRFRDDKKHGNHRDVVTSVIESIQDGVEVDALLQGAAAVRTAWKQRESRGGNPPPHQPPVASRTGHPPPPPPQPPQSSAPQPSIQLRWRPFPPNEYGRVSGPIMVAGMMR